MLQRSSASIVCGQRHTISIINEEGDVISFGCSFNLAHGHNEKKVPIPIRVSDLKYIKSLVTGEYHTACLDVEGSIFTFGCNSTYGQLGIGIVENMSTHVPQKVNVPRCTQVSCGERFTMCLTEDGLLYSFGYNVDGQLGLGDNAKSYCAPQLIPSLKDVEFVECGRYHTFCKLCSNEVYSWGYNNDGQLGLGDNGTRITPTQCNSLLKETIVDIKCGFCHVLVLISKGEVLACGYNAFGQLGRSSVNSSSPSFQKVYGLPVIKRIECGDNHSMCINDYGDLYIFGNNAYGQLGLGDTRKRDSPVRHPSVFNIIDISSGGCHTFVKTSNNEIYAFGRSDYLQFGVETNNPRQLSPIRVYEENEDIWFSKIKKSKAKSARSVIQ